MDMAQLGPDCLVQEYISSYQFQEVFSFECPPDKVGFVEVEALGYMESREVSKFRHFKDRFPNAGWQHSACMI